jgi:hypothetical protein
MLTAMAIFSNEEAAIGKGLIAASAAGGGRRRY